jgi:hypothetical protein
MVLGATAMAAKPSPAAVNIERREVSDSNDVLFILVLLHRGRSLTPQFRSGNARPLSQRLELGPHDRWVKAKPTSADRPSASGRFHGFKAGGDGRSALGDRSGQTCGANVCDGWSCIGILPSVGAVGARKDRLSFDGSFESRDRISICGGKVQYSLGRGRIARMDGAG